jgi:hypothetical protein
VDFKHLRLYDCHRRQSRGCRPLVSRRIVLVVTGSLTGSSSLFVLAFCRLTGG